MLKIPGRVYTQFATVLGLAGSENVKGLQSEVVPTQDLTRFLQATQVKHTIFTRTQTMAIDNDILILNWNDASDWTEVQVDGALTTRDSDLAQPSDDRWLLMVSLQITVPALWLTAECKRRLNDASASDTYVQSFSDVPAGHSMAIPETSLLPMVLSTRENIVVLRMLRSGAGPGGLWSIQMISAEPGVLAAFPGA